MDQIIIENLRIEGILGIYPQERIQRQTVLVNATLFTDIDRAVASEDIADTVNYAEVCKLITGHVVTAKSFLVERLVVDIARLVLESYPPVQQIRVRVTKPNAIPEATAVGVEIVRTRADFGL